jgi:hypothetical protein
MDLQQRIVFLRTTCFFVLLFTHADWNTNRNIDRFYMSATSIAGLPSGTFSGKKQRSTTWDEDN